MYSFFVLSASPRCLCIFNFSIYICSRIISADMLSGVFMPARFLVFREKGSSECVLAFLKPTAFAKLFDSSELMALARTLEEDMQQISEEIIG